MRLLTLTLSAVCQQCGTTLQRAPRLRTTYGEPWAMLNVEPWQVTARICQHNEAGLRFVAMLEEEEVLGGSEKA